MIKPGLVSIIMPVLNGSRTIKAAIESALHQQYTDFELIIIDDGSTDDTASLIREFTDLRIVYHHQQNKGVSAARNAALALATGQFFCFLDADDLLPPKSLKSRVEILQGNNAVFFADGATQVTDIVKNEIVRSFTPRFRGKPRQKLLQLDSSCFYGNTWMIRRVEDQTYKFDETIHHGEDLDFFLSISDMGLYDFTNDTILIQQVGLSSAMSNLAGLEKGYMLLLKKWKDRKYISGFPALLLKLKIMKIMFLSHLAAGDLKSAVMSSVNLGLS